MVREPKGVESVATEKTNERFYLGFRSTSSKQSHRAKFDHQEMAAFFRRRISGRSKFLDEVSCSLKEGFLQDFTLFLVGMFSGGAS